MLFLSVYCE